jgi:hypothetical protein
MTMALTLTIPTWLLIFVLVSWAVSLSATIVTLLAHDARNRLALYQPVFKGFLRRWLIATGLVGVSIVLQLITAHTLPSIFIVILVAWLAPGRPLLLWANLRPSTAA